MLNFYYQISIFGLDISVSIFENLNLESSDALHIGSIANISKPLGFFFRLASFSLILGRQYYISVMTPPHLLHINIHFLKRLKKNVELDNRMIFDRTRR